MSRTAEQAATEISRAYTTEINQTGQDRGDWVRIVTLMERTDLTHDEWTAGARHLARHGYTVAPTSNQKTLTELDERYALWIGGQWKHVIAASN